MDLAYLIAQTFDDESWSGGLLITDKRGLPLDFRYVKPIRPTRIQKLIYGGALQRFLLLDAIAGTLLRDSKLKAKWVFTIDPILLELDQNGSTRFISVSTGDSEPLMTVGEWHKEEKGRISIQLASSGPPTRLSFNSPTDEDTDRVAGELSELAKELDFSEPLNRVGQALVEICQNGTV